jgi:hypothetical protein
MRKHGIRLPLIWKRPTKWLKVFKGCSQGLSALLSGTPLAMEYLSAGGF